MYMRSAGSERSQGGKPLTTDGINASLRSQLGWSVGELDAAYAAAWEGRKRRLALRRERSQAVPATVPAVQPLAPSAAGQRKTAKARGSA